MVSVEEARIHAHVCGDGYLTTYLEKRALQVVKGRRYRRLRVRYVVGYSNSELLLIREFVRDVKSAYGVKCRVLTRGKNFEARLRSRRVFMRLRELGAGRSREWIVGEEILRADENVRREWLRAFFDDEARIAPDEGRIRVKSVNLRGLRLVSLMLTSLEIQSRITGPNSDGTWYLVISRDDVIHYIKKVGFLHPAKIRAAMMILKRSSPFKP
ncbi:hypothetical protein B6U66_02885 [Candidatus Bathyarchaeota archaeon ex4484_135]|nr:MAG: hypothetical protein B6U66_02885 [Candidatus Bathyarchaeota archaeon ex4484_135]